MNSECCLRLESEVVQSFEVLIEKCEMDRGCCLRRIHGWETEESHCQNGEG